MGASKARQGSVTEGSTPSAFTKGCVGLSSPSASASTTGGMSMLAGPASSPTTPLPPAREETLVQDRADRRGSLPRLASSARTRAKAHEGVMSPSNSPIASAVVIGRLEASQVPRETPRANAESHVTPLVVGLPVPAH